MEALIRFLANTIEHYANVNIASSYSSLLNALEPSLLTDPERSDIKSCQRIFFTNNCITVSSFIIPPILFFALNRYKLGRIKRLLAAGSTGMCLFFGSEILVYRSINQIRKGSTPLGALLRSNFDGREADSISSSIIERLIERDPEFGELFITALEQNEEAPQRLKRIFEAKRELKGDSDVYSSDL
eukprot:TRINITY_DN8396_c0_g1_i1.p1 TRINITY_DN8396_c0_g1~~TRINITY_DN8396_c0_g1_i1.p1  ORF type:complete len:186 (+),score=39.53 TRINITY_DN8396_c0_g1_i1:25-582(+)